jgi:hypothetical protein
VRWSGNAQEMDISVYRAALWADAGVDVLLSEEACGNSSSTAALDHVVRPHDKPDENDRGNLIGTANSIDLVRVRRSAI